MVVLFFTPLLRYMPKPVMAAIIIVAVSKMADFAEFYVIWQQRKAEVALWLMPFLGTLVIGDPGSGKTWLVKQFIASCAVQLTSLKQIVVLDLKGDLTQMIRGMPGNGDSSAFDECVDVRVYTVGSDMGLRSTLSPFNRTLELNSFDLSTTEGKRKFHTLATDVAADVLSGTVYLDKTGNARLEGGFDMPTRWEASGTHGVRASDDKKIASSLIDSVRKVFFKCKVAGASVPTSYDELLRELNQADQPHVGGPGNDGKPARPIVMGPVTQEDLTAVKREIEVRMDPSGGYELLYQPIKGAEAQPRDDDVYPLDPSTFLGAREDDKRVKLSIINLALLGNGYGADTMRTRQHVKKAVSIGGATVQQPGLLGWIHQWPRSLSARASRRRARAVQISTRGHTRYLTARCHAVHHPQASSPPRLCCAASRPTPARAAVRRPRPRR